MNDKVYLKKTFNTPIERVFEALTTSQMVTQWFGPKNCKTVKADIDLAVGGKYSYEIETARSRFFIEGEYLEIVRPTRLVYTSRYRNLPGAEQMTSVISLDLSPSEGETELQFVQELHWVEQDMANRTEAWEIMFSRLSDLLTTTAP